tara:strand:- start:1028 stop:1702 length:675 start_codon:yes stop_codon:yes gene_type:complete
MLKPKKNIAKKEIQRDPFLESVDKAQAHLETNKKKYTNICLAILAALVGYNTLSNRQTSTSAKASAELGIALTSLDKGDTITAEFQLETIYSDYSGTQSAVNAGYFAGKLNYDKNKYDLAKPQIANYIKNSKDKFMYTPATLILSSIARFEGNNDQALDYINNGIKKCSLKNELNLLNIHKANILIDIGDRAAAKSIIDQILEEKNLSIGNKKLAQEILGKLMT